jgi:glycosyltransferase involved in cell wall biosynthesis
MNAAEFLMAAEAKIRIETPYAWESHRGGWATVVKYIKSHFDNPKGVLLVSAVEDHLIQVGPITEPWVGFVHQVPFQDLSFPDLSRLLVMDDWKQSELHCRGLFVLCHYVKHFLRSRGVALPISVVPYPQETDVPRFSWKQWQSRTPRTLLHVGEFLRNYQAFFDLSAPGYQKVMLTNPDLNVYMDRLGIQRHSSVKMVPRVENETYDRMLSESVVFLNLKDAVAVTAILECVVRQTPVLVNRVGAVTELLGNDYPLLYDTIQEAEQLLMDQDAIRSAHEYLVTTSLAERCTFSAFHSAFTRSAVYRSLPEPRRAATFAPCDLTVVLCSYRRVTNIRALLEAFGRQSFSGSFEVVLWNNNESTQAEIARIVREAPPHVDVRLIQSTHNYFCAARLAVCAIARAPLLLFCDDDVTIHDGYIQYFLDTYRERRARHGANVAVCARGHRFLPHSLDEEDPARIWEEYNHVAFFDESAPETDIDFMHADNMLVPTHLVRRALQIPLPRNEWILIDDYWLSFVLSYYFKCKLIKVQAHDVLGFVESADDPDIALFHNPEVHSERISFYIYHMRAGWPRLPSPNG